MADIFGKALQDYQKGQYTEDIKTYSSLDEEDVIPLPYLFRTFSEMPQIEQKALQLARGKVLDVGAGAGSHSLYLQNKGLEVTALDSSKGCIEVCQARGVASTICSPILDYSEERYDTLLLLMNGIGLAGQLKNLSGFFPHLASLLRPNGQILLDSSDIIYMFEQDEDGGYWIPNDGTYYGEVQFEMEYKGQKSEPFDWVYVDFDTLQNACESNGFNCELVISGEHFDYLAKLTLKT
ncbi:MULTISPECIES: class I SAM-dependent methyltransferase [unclassified Allomuricauda]|uniref:class I SAM-dependent methyltransferase n=1 Tax=unclassified Allomuricauda TaxID=2615049 RepID=UPI00273F3E17|nr:MULTISPECIES: class I SAM-dependent methyltransferase [unclassified Allomuricauda]